MRLPNAPLVEVVFELRWEAVENVANGQPQFGFDPGLHALVAALDADMPHHGFVEQEYLGAGPAVLYSIVKRYRRRQELFPLIQVGHGIVAINVSTEYDWNKFNALCVSVIELVERSYPKIGDWSLNPLVAELRYIDVFNDDLGAVENFSEFVNSSLNAQIQFPTFGPGYFSGQEMGRISLARTLTDDPSTRVSLDIHSGAAGETEGVVMTTKVVKAIQDREWAGEVSAKASHWLERAHTITSPLFSDLVHNSLMEKFR